MSAQGGHKNQNDLAVQPFHATVVLQPREIVYCYYS